MKNIKNQPRWKNKLPKYKSKGQNNVTEGSNAKALITNESNPWKASKTGPPRNTSSNVKTIGKLKLPKDNSKNVDFEEMCEAFMEDDGIISQGGDETSGDDTDVDDGIADDISATTVAHRTTLSSSKRRSSEVDRADCEDHNGDDGGEVDEEAEVALHKEELKQLRKHDPEFFAYLARHDSALLKFGRDSKVISGADRKRSRQTMASSEDQSSSVFDEDTMLRKFTVWVEDKRGTAIGLYVLTAALQGALRADGLMLRGKTRDVMLGNANANTTTGKNHQHNKNKNPLAKRIKTGSQKDATGNDADETGMDVHVASDMKKVYSGVVDFALKVYWQYVEDVAAVGVAGTPSVDNKDKMSSGGISSGDVCGDAPYALAWRKVAAAVSKFWGGAVRLLSAPGTHCDELKSDMLSCISHPIALKWLLPYTPRITRILKESGNLWSRSPSHQTRILAFLVFRNFMTVAANPKNHLLTVENHRRGLDADTGMGDDSASTGASGTGTGVSLKQAFVRQRKGHQNRTKLLEVVVDRRQSAVVQLYVCFQKSTLDYGSSAITWKSLQSVKFRLNCVVELLSNNLDPFIAYRVAFLGVRRLALSLRAGCLNASRQSTTSEKNSKGKLSQQLPTTRRRTTTANTDAMFNDPYRWSFIFCSRLWIDALGELPFLRPLAFPLCSVLNSLIKTKSEIAAWMPFTFHILRQMDDLSSCTNAFIPLGSHLLHTSQAFIQAASREQPSNATMGGADVEIDLHLKFEPSALSSPQVLRPFLSRFLFVLVDHFGMMSRHPSFPEVYNIIAFHLKKLSQIRLPASAVAACFRKELRDIMAVAQRSVDYARAERLKFENPHIQCPADKFLLFEEGKCPLAVLRLRLHTELLESSQARLKIEYEADVDEQRRKVLLDESNQQSKIQRKRLRHKENKRLERLAMKASKAQDSVDMSNDNSADEQQDSGMGTVFGRHMRGEDLVEDFVLSSDGES
eukprot:Lankesteria_metandrocarpae@DN4200_c0_g1_i2.p1